MEVFELAKILLPVVAIIISIISLTKSNQNTKRQIRIGRIEEIIECLRMYIPDYHVLYIAYQHQHIYKNAPKNLEVNQIDILKNNYLDAIKIFKENNNIEVLREKTSRLIMLADSYLPNKELKKRVISITGLMSTLLQCTIYDNYEQTKKMFIKYPTPMDFFEYAVDLQNQLIKEMKLGHNSLEFKDLMAYENKFLKDLKISR